MKYLYLFPSIWLTSFGLEAYVESAQSQWYHPFWLEGCWNEAEGDTREVWDAGYDGLLFGRSTTVKERELKLFEDLRIERRGKVLIFSASPNGALPAEFIGVRQTPVSITFENAAHDFPQRIHYEVKPDGISAAISDIEGKQWAIFEMSACAEPYRVKLPLGSAGSLDMQ
ncbi:MAG: DUF6265 family protein [Pseudomonadota bacterium]